MDLSVFFLMPLSVEPVVPKWVLIRVGKMVAAIVRALEQVGAGFPFFCLKSWWVDFVVGLAAPTKFLMVF